MIFTSPLMLLGLLGVPALAAIYWLRSRSQRVVVSSLVLWLDQRRPQQGGRILQRMQTPLTFSSSCWPSPCWRRRRRGRRWCEKRPRGRWSWCWTIPIRCLPASRRADRNSPRRQAEIELINEFARDNYVTRFLLAGPQPRQIGQSLRTARRCPGRAGGLGMPEPLGRPPPARSRPRPNWAAAGPESSCSPIRRPA